MPKKSATARGGTQRSKPKAQKNIELVRPVAQEPSTDEADAGIAENTASTADITDTAATSAPEVISVSTPSVSKRRSVSETPAAPEVQKERDIPTPGAAAATSTASTEVTPKGSAAARLAARRQATQKAQQRSAPALITPEHYAYVRKDLVFIAILASIMFLIIIILHFVPGIGA